MKTNPYTAIVYSAHLGTKRENIGDILSAKAIAILSGYSDIKLFCLPNETGLSSDRPVIYGGGGMIRPLFSKKVFKDFLLRKKNQPYAIYGVGINCDVNGDNFSREDFNAMETWLKTARSVTARDKTSYNFIQKKFDLKIKLAPCPAYNVLKSRKNRLLKSRYQLGIILSFGHTEAYDSFRDDIVAISWDMIRKVGKKNVSFICHDEKDKEEITKMYGHLGVSIVKPLNFDQIYESYSNCDLIFSLRGHGVIFAAAVNRPCSYIPLNVKLNALYSYHYGENYRDINFNADYHLYNLNKRKLPLDINTNFSI